MSSTAPLVGSAVVTSKIGPGNTYTPGTLSNVSLVTFDLNAQVVRVVANGNNIYYDMAATATVSCTVSGTSFTFVVSQ